MQRYNKISIGDVSKKIEVRQRHFEIWEAEELIPKLEFYITELQNEKKQIHSLANVLKKCSSAGAENPGGVVIDPICENLQLKLKHECSEYVSVIEKIAEMGVVVDDLDIMAFDFYSWVDGEEVMLCWQSGENHVYHWHYPEESFSERRVLDVIDILSSENEEQFLH